MTGRKHNLVLFYEKKMKKILINNRLIRSYMNHFVIDEIAETEINAVYNIKKNERIAPLVEEAVRISKELLLDK